MKTRNYFKSLTWVLVMLLIAGTGSKSFAGNGQSVRQMQDSIKYTSISGKVIDKETNKPVMFTSIFISGTSVGTVSNSDGGFIIKVPENEKDAKIAFSNIGYKNLEVDIASLKTKDNVIYLQPALIPISEVKVRTGDPVKMLQEALANVPENYYTTPENMTAFYRETIKQNRHYVAVSEAILKLYKGAYNKLENDQVKIYKGRKSQDVKRMDTIVFKLQGGPSTMVFLDLLKTPNMVLDPEAFQYYNYKLVGMLNVDDRQNYVIEFDQKENVNYPLYKGKIYLDADNLAVTNVEFQLSDKGLDKAANVLVRKKPLSLKVEPEGGFYMVNYRQDDTGKWYLNHVRTELIMKCKWDRKLFSSTYTAVAEMAVTNKTDKNVNKFKYRETSKMNDVFIDNVSEYYDKGFWEDFNYIKPEESIEDAVEKINKRMRRIMSSND